MEYKASLDTSTKTITALVLVILIAVCCYKINEQIILMPDIKSVLSHSGLIFFLIAVIVASYVYAPKAYLLDNHWLTIIRPINNQKIKLTNITSVTEVADSEMLGAIRAFGNGGLFGYYGKYYVPKIGWATFYATQRKNRILIITQQGKKILITPDDKSMMEDLKSKLTATV